jgi:hypothetical protein
MRAAHGQAIHVAVKASRAIVAAGMVSGLAGRQRCVRSSSGKISFSYAKKRNLWCFAFGATSHIFAGDRGGSGVFASTARFAVDSAGAGASVGDGAGIASSARGDRGGGGVFASTARFAVGSAGAGASVGEGAGIASSASTRASAALVYLPAVQAVQVLVVLSPPKVV